MRFFIIFLLAPVFCSAQIITTFAGGGTTLGDGGPATAALIDDPAECAFNKKGEFFVACLVDNRIRKINTSGIITTVAGTGIGGYSGDQGPATAAKIKLPEGVTLDSVGNLFFSEGGNHTIRRVDATTGVITTICGNGSPGYGGDNGQASSAQLRAPEGIRFDKSGNLYIADGDNNCIRKINTSGIITTIAGIGVYGFSGDGGPATAAQLHLPVDVLTDDAGNVYISDEGNARIRKINIAGIISTYAGNGTGTYIGDGMPALNAQFAPTYINFNLTNELYISDEGNFRIYKIDHSGIFHLVAGNGMAASNGDGGPATAAAMDSPSGIAFDTCDNLYLSNVNYNRIRKVALNPLCINEGINNIKEQTSLSIYPNPAYDLLNIDNLKTQATYRLLSIIGAAVRHGNLKEGSNSINVGAIPNGMYILEVIDDEGKRIVSKIVKQ